MCDTVEPAVLLLDNQPDRRAVILARAFNELGLVWLGLWKSTFGHLDAQLISNHLLDANLA